MGWDINEVRVDTLLPDDPEVHIGTITGESIAVGGFTWDPTMIPPPLTGDQYGHLRRTVMKGSS